MERSSSATASRSSSSGARLSLLCSLASLESSSSPRSGAAGWAAAKCRPPRSNAGRGRLFFAVSKSAGLSQGTSPMRAAAVSEVALIVRCRFRLTPDLSVPSGWWQTKSSKGMPGEFV